MSETVPFDPVPLLARDLNLGAGAVAAVVQLLSDGNTVPFIARYRKERTGDLDETQIRAIRDMHESVVELHRRRQSILATIEEQGKLTDELRERILACTTRARLEDLYLPYRPRRRTRATMAREKGLEPLAERILAQPPDGDPMAEARAFVDPEKDVADEETALAGARDIVAEVVAEDADVRALVRDVTVRTSRVVSSKARGVKDPTKFSDWYDYQEPSSAIPSHRYLAVSRGEKEGVLRICIAVDAEPLVDRILKMKGHTPSSPFADQMAEAVTDGFGRLLHPSAETEMRSVLKKRSDEAAVEVFASNLANLLLAPAFGTRPVVGVDPGLRTGCKCAAVDATGKMLGHMVFHLVSGQEAKSRATQQLAVFLQDHQPHAVAVGNGTGSREAEAFVRETLRAEGLTDVLVVSVSEAGASVYSASEVAIEEFPDLDVTVRGAISIARRLQDPLAELVKIDPRSIGVGQYQHDVNQALLARKLDEVVESCVNRVGVALNTASASLLSRVAGVGPALARSIVQYREQHGAFTARKQLLKVDRLGPRAFQQAAGFLRITGGENPLDGSAVHPERYDLVQRMARDLEVSVDQLVGSSQLASRIDISRYVDDEVGEPTLRDIVSELEKPGRDPREDFQAPAFSDEITSIEDLKEGMQMQGVVSNVTAFGAFVDIGVHRDGLVHISELSDRFVRDPAEVVKVGDRIDVRVIEVDLDRHRISLSARSGEPRQKNVPRPGGGDRASGKPRSGAQGRPSDKPRKKQDRPAPQPRQKQKPGTYNPFADALKNRSR